MSIGCILTYGRLCQLTRREDVRLNSETLLMQEIARQLFFFLPTWRINCGLRILVCESNWMAIGVEYVIPSFFIVFLSSLATTARASLLESAFHATCFMPGQMITFKRQNLICEGCFPAHTDHQRFTHLETN